MISTSLATSTPARSSSTRRSIPIHRGAAAIALVLVCLLLGACSDILLPGETSTPAALVESLNEAMAEEPVDLAYFFRQFRFENESHAQMAEATAEFFSTLIALDFATQEKFGESVWADLAANLQSVEFDSVELVDAGDDRGTIRVTSADDGTTEEIEIVKAEGRWWLDASSMGDTFEESEAEAESATRQFELLTAALTAVREKLGRGEFGSAEEVETAIQDEMARAMLAAMAAES